jgi:catechol 2,3-dioxygenase-like lactoylglutathione lyase family enzyme
MISHVGHVALRVPDVDASTRYATEVLGLVETDRTDTSAYLALPSHMLYPTSHHVVEYHQGDTTALDHVGLEATDAAALGELRERLARAGTDVISDEPEEPGIAAAIRFAGPDGHLFEVFAGMDEELRAVSTRPPKPRRLGHITITVGESVDATLSFMTDVLGFQISDYIGTPPLVAFTRCNPLHHGIGLSVGEPGLHHYAFEVETGQDLMTLGDALDQAGATFVWGPGRHAAGDNIAVYHLDVAGALIEHYSDMQLIFDDVWEPRHWSVDDPKMANRWGPVPQASLNAFGVGLAKQPRTTPA